jgi:hypothetical protein
MTEKPKGTKKLASSPQTEAHVEALAKKIMEDPSFPLLHETARKMSEKYAKKDGQG